MAERLTEQQRTTRVFLAGRTGLVGSAILRSLQECRYDNLLLRTRAELDLTDQAWTRTFSGEEQPQMVILVAARVGGTMANWKHSYESIQENLAIELNVIREAFRTSVKRPIFLGSSCIYPRPVPQLLKEEYLPTGSLKETNRPYAIAKIAGIELCHSPRASTLRSKPAETEASGSSVPASSVSAGGPTRSLGRRIGQPGV